MPIFGTSLAARASRRMHSITNQLAAAAPGASSSRGAGRLVPNETALLVCDLQERFRPIIAGMPAVIETARRMIQGATALKLPVILTEQYPKALGNTVKELADVLPEGTLVQDKTHFSMIVDPVKEQLKGLPHVRKILLLGIETHVCVFQTAVDLLEGGYEVHLVVDGVSSQRQTDRAVAIEHPAFKTISGLAKEERPDFLPEAYQY